MKYRIVYDGVRYTVSDGAFPTLSVSRMKKGEKIYAERNSCIASSPIYAEDEKDERNPGKDKFGEEIGGLRRRRVMADELEGEDYEPPIMPTHLSQMFSSFVLSTKQTIARKQMGERSYILYEALENDQKVTFRSNFPGMIMPWDATPMAEDEYWVNTKQYYKDHKGERPRSVFNEKRENRPHGIINVVKKSFLAANMKVKAKIFHVDDKVEKVKIKQLSETDNTFQQFTGNGMVFFEVHGDLQEIPLYPNESVDVFVGYLLGFTDGISLRMKPAGDSILRNEENSDYVIHLRAGDKGGYVYTHSVKIPDFHKKVNPEFFSRAETLAFNAQKERVNNG